MRHRFIAQKAVVTAQRMIISQANICAQPASLTISSQRTPQGRASQGVIEKLSILISLETTAYPVWRPLILIKQIRNVSDAQNSAALAL
jgi:hypothetical protein